MSAADGLPRKEQDGSAILSTLTIWDGWQSSNALVLKPSEPARLRGCNSYTIRQHLTPNQRKSYATRHPLPKSVAVSQELQTKLEIQTRPACETCDASSFPRWPKTETRMKTNQTQTNERRSIRAPLDFTFPSCSSRAERPPDKRKTSERYRAGRPAFAIRIR